MARHISGKASGPTGPHGWIVHRSPGRTRLRFAGHRHDRPFFERLTEQLRAMPGVTSVESNAVTGSVLIHHSVGIGPLLARARNKAIFFVIEEGGLLRGLSQAANRFTRGLDRQLRRSTGNQISLPLFLSFVFLLMAFTKLAQGDSRASAVNLLLSAVHAATSHSRSDVAEEEEEVVEAAGAAGEFS